MRKFSTIILCLLSVIMTKAQVGIGTDTPDPSALLEVSSENQGLLLNRVDLKSPTDTQTISETKVGMVVYATNSYNLGAENEIQGDNLYLFNGTKWVRMFNADELDGRIESLNIPINSMYVYSKQNFNLATNNSQQDILYPAGSVDTYVNPLLITDLGNSTYKFLSKGAVMISGFANILQNSTNASWSLKILISKDNGATWSSSPSQVAYCSHFGEGGPVEPLYCFMQQAYSVEANDIIKMVITKISGTVTTVNLSATADRYSSGFNAIFYPTN